MFAARAIGCNVNRNRLGIGVHLLSGVQMGTVRLVLMETVRKYLYRLYKPHPTRQLQVLPDKGQDSESQVTSASCVNFPDKTRDPANVRVGECMSMNMRDIILGRNR
jgi:hypothetical protein